MLMQDGVLWRKVDEILDNLNDSKDKRQTLHDMMKSTIEVAERRGGANAINLSLTEMGLSDMSEPEFVVNMVDELLNPSNPDDCGTGLGERFKNAVAFVVKAKVIWTERSRAQ